MANSIALIHDYLLVLRGAERSFAAMADCWPEAPIYTLLWDPEKMRPRLGGRVVHTSYLQRAGVRQAHFRRLLPLFPHAVGRLPVARHDVVLSSSSAFAHGVHRGPDAVHICYCHSPFRYVWHERGRALEEAPGYVRPFMGPLLDGIRRWDVKASRGVDHYIANSEITRDRIRDFYGRDAVVIHPPVDVERFQPGSPEDFFLVVGEVVPHKRVERALEAARRAGRPIKVVGDGPLARQLASDYASSAEFLGRVSDERLIELYASARALVVPNVEEFGIAAVEAQAAGRPVLAIDAGGTRETVIQGETGVLVPADDADGLADAMRSVDFDAFAPERAVANARRFSTSEFQRKLMAYVEEVTAR